MLAYLVAISAMLFAGLSALTLFHAVRHFDPPEAVSSTERVAADHTLAA
jgi:hypothetical protein